MLTPTCKLLIGLALLTGSVVRAQSDEPISTVGELPLYRDSLIYKPSTVARLRKVVDSLNLKYKACSYDRPYLSAPQTEGAYLRFETSNKGRAEHLEQLLRSGADSTNLIRECKTDTSGSYKFVRDYFIYDLEPNEDGTISVMSLPRNYFNEILRVSPTQISQWKKGEWIIQKGSDSYSRKKYWVRAIRPEEAAASRPLPDHLGRMVMYADCIIDSSKTIRTKSQSDYNSFDRKAFTKSAIAMKQFYKKYGLDLGQPKRPKYDPELEDEDDEASPKVKAYRDAFTKYEQEYGMWTERKNQIIKSIESKDQICKDLIKLVSDQYGSVFTSEAGQWIASYCDRTELLQIARNQTIVGGCSQDDSPRMHAQSLAVYGAEEGVMEVFLRSHMNILNDRFQRVSDGSYAWGRRGTYIRELEAMDIDVPKLLLGTVLRVSNGSEKRYVSSVGRLGRAIVESKDRERFVGMIKEAIGSEELDPFNRVVMQNLMLAYIYHIPTWTEHERALAEYKVFAKSLPDYLRLVAQKAELRRKD